MPSGTARMLALNFFAAVVFSVKKETIVNLGIDEVLTRLYCVWKGFNPIVSR